MTSTIQRYVALEHDFGLDCDHPRLAPYLSGLFAPFARPGTPRSVYRLRRDLTDPSRATLDLDGEVIADRADLPFAVGMLLWHLNRHTVEVSHGHVLLHAGVAERDGRAVLLPAAMESGKTTLVAGLVRTGMRYLSDEIAALDPDSLRVHPYPKALSVDPGSWGVLADLNPDLAPELRELLPPQWQVPATSIRPDALSPPAAPVLVVMPRYVPDARTTLDRVEPIDAVALLAGCTFELTRQPERDLAVLVRLLRRAPCYRLSYSSLSQACDTVGDLMAGEMGAVA